jgi:predicted kinase
MQVVICRGIPGSGKSTWIKNNFSKEEVTIFSADNFHMKDGIYQYDPRNAADAHDYCLKTFMNHLIEWERKDLPIRKRWGNDVLVVDNTNTKAWELSPYVRLAEIHLIPFKIVRLHVPFEVAVRRNIHNIPTATIWKMWQNLIKEELPWVEEIVTGDYNLPPKTYDSRKEKDEDLRIA